MEYTDPPDPDLDVDYDLLPDYNAGLWEPLKFRYGLYGLLRCREAMMPISKPEEMVHLKFLVGLTPAFDERPDPDDALGPPPDPQPRGGGGDRKGRGKGGKERQKGGRVVPDMGKTEVMQGFVRGQWWRNATEEKLDVIVREQFSLASPEIWKVPPGHYVQQGGPCEVFITGQALGLQRMPVQPRGWATVDATQVGGPKYLEKVAAPRWKIIFSSGSQKGDIVVRETESLESEEVANLFCGTCVEQTGPQHCLEDGIIRMPVMFAENAAAPAKGSGSFPPSASGSRTGWVTCDASSQGGPRFFEPCPEEMEQPPPTQLRQSQPATFEDEFRTSGGQTAGGTWDKNRVWKVVNLGPGQGQGQETGPPARQLPIVTRPEPYAPGTGKSPPEEAVVRWLQDGDVVEQVGHSKKMRGFMVMPVRFVSAAEGGRDDGEKQDGWVTRRSVDKTRDDREISWFEEVRCGDDGEYRQRRRVRRGHDTEAARLD